MSESQGWIKNHRSKLKWGWFTTPLTAHFFEYCLLKATHTECEYKGRVIQRGSFWFGRKVASLETGLTERQIRTAINHLKSTNELTIKTSPQGSVIAIVNWDKYQDTTNIETNKRPTNDQRATTYKNVKNVKNVKNNTCASKMHDMADQIYDAYPKKKGKAKGIEKLKKHLSKNPNDYDKILSSAKKLRQRVDVGSQDLQYVPLFSSWVNQQRWEDDLSDSNSYPEIPDIFYQPDYESTEVIDE